MLLPAVAVVGYLVAPGSSRRYFLGRRASSRNRTPLQTVMWSDS
jgi:hypothetical protein